MARGIKKCIPKIVRSCDNIALTPIINSCVAFLMGKLSHHFNRRGEVCSVIIFLLVTLRIKKAKIIRVML